MAEDENIWKVVSQFLPAAVAALLLVISGAAGIIAPVTSANQLTVIGSLISAGDHWEIRGRVLRDGEAVDKALVWGIVEYANGQHDSPPATQTDEKGGFSVSPVRSTVGTEKDTIVAATISARKEIPAAAWYKSAMTLRGEDLVRAPGTVSQEIVELSPYKLLPLPAIFLVSVMLPFFGQQTRGKYLLAIVLAFFFTGLMIAYLSLSLRYVNTAGKSKDILALGFASVYQGTYVKDVQPEWMFSLTASPPKPVGPTPLETNSASDTTSAPATPQVAAKSPPGTTAATSGASAPPVQAIGTSVQKLQTNTGLIDRGFGAPLWVLLISVIGASVLTVGLIVREISDIPAADQPDKIRDHLQVIVQHQFYILFAPVGAIFVYQTLVVGSAASSSFTVELAALGAGASLSGLLTKAVTSATKLFVS